MKGIAGEKIEAQALCRGQQGEEIGSVPHYYAGTGTQLCSLMGMDVANTCASSIES